MTSIDIICPVFREEDTILRFHEALVAATDPLRATMGVNFIYVIDPSGDRSEDILREIAERTPHMSVVVMSRRFGHQAALIAGLDVSRSDAVIMLDSDLQHPPDLIPSLVHHWQDGADIVQALRQDNAKIGMGKRVTSHVFYRLFERFTKIKINSGAADYRLLSRRVVDVFCDQLRERNPFLRGLVTWVGYKIVYVPFAPAQRLGGRSNYSVSALMVFAVNGLCSFSKLPLRLCTWLGLTFAALSILGGFANLGVYFLFSEGYAPGWASLFALMTFGVGINLFFLGVLGEYVGLIFDEVKQRPRYLIGATYGATASVTAGAALQDKALQT